MRLYEAWQRNLEELLYRQGGLVLLHTALFVIGLIFGALALRSLDAAARIDLARQLSDSMQILASGPAQPPGLLVREALARQALQVAMLWVLSISLVGALGAMLLPLYRGFISGFTVAFLTAEMGTRGILLAAAGHLPQTLLEVPGVILAVSASVAFSLEIIRSWRARRRLTGFYAALAEYSNTLLSAAVLLVGAGLVEGYVTPLLVRLVSP